MKTRDIEQELTDTSCFMNCGGAYCSKEQEKGCSSWLRGQELSKLLKERQIAAEYVRSNPRPVFKTSRDYEKAILIRQEESEVCYA